RRGDHLRHRSRPVRCAHRLRRSPGPHPARPLNPRPPWHHPSAGSRSAGRRGPVLADQADHAGMARSADTSDLAGRIARLEAIEEIKALKHRYLRACDAKDPEAFRACFVSSGASIDYGALGAFDDADGIVKVFE